jgi:hypothetical protein
MEAATVLPSCPVCHGLNDDHALTCTWDPDAETRAMEARIAEIQAKLAALQAPRPAPVAVPKRTKATVGLPADEVAYIESELAWAKAHGWELPYRVGKKGTRGQPDTFTLRNDSMTKFHASLMDGARRRMEAREMRGRPVIVVPRKGLTYSQDATGKWSADPRGIDFPFKLPPGATIVASGPA